jgi:3-phosphoshikimate 1-carboxyvinyltransferase
VSARTVYPGRLRGRVRAPPSKSYTHRALVAGFLSRRRFHVRSPLDSEDTRATARALRALGSHVERSRARWTVSPGRTSRRSTPPAIDCGESGTTLRFGTALAALSNDPVQFRGRGRLGHRPMRPLVDALTELGADVRPVSGSLPFTVRGPIRGGRVRLDASESSQFASALLLVLPTLSQDSRIDLEGPIVSEPYLEATLAVLRRLGVEVRRTRRSFVIRGGQGIGGGWFDVPGDASSAAYLWAAGAIGGGVVSVTGVSRSWPQADLAILDLLRISGATVRETNGSVAVGPGTPRPFSVDLTPCPDLYPLVGVLAASIPGTSHLRGAAHVIHKESNRRTETARLVRAFGARVRSGPSGLTIEGRDRLRPVHLPHLTDHRLVMSAAVGALAATGPSRVGEAAAVRKSFPGFWSTLRELHGRVGAR